MKGKIIKKYGNICAILILVMGGFSSVGFFSTSVRAQPVNDAAVIAADGEVSFDGDGDGYISPYGKDDIAIEWTVDYAPETSYIRIKADGKVTSESFYEDGNCIRMVRWCTEAMSNVFGSKNTIQIWYGRKLRGYSEITFTLPKKVEDFPLEILSKNIRAARSTVFLEKLFEINRLSELISQKPMVSRILEKLGFY